jgi:hypothetical protein
MESKKAGNTNKLKLITNFVDAFPEFVCNFYKICFQNYKLLLIVRTNEIIWYIEKEIRNRYG